MIETQNEKYIRLLFLLLGFLACITLLPAKVLAAAPPAGVTVLVEGKPLDMPVPPVIVDGRTLVGARSVGEAVGGQVAWDPVKRQVTITRRSDTIILTLGKNEALVNGKPVPMEVPAQLVNNSTMVPLRFIAESLGGSVEWNGDTRTANILRKPSAITDWSYSKDVGKAQLKLTFSEPVDSITPSLAGDSTLVLTFYPAEIKTPSIAQYPLDGLIKGYSLQPDGRKAQLVVQLWTAPSYSYSLSPDGTQLTIDFRYTVTDIQYQLNGRVPTVNIATTGKANYTTQVLTGPDRLVIDLPGTALGSQVPATVEGGQPLVNRVRSAPFSKDPLVTRVVIDLAKAHDYDIVSTDLGIQVRFVPRIVDVKTENLAGKTRLSVTTSLPADALVTVPDNGKMVITLAGAISGLDSNTVKIGSGGIDTVTAVSDPTTNSTVLTVSLQYYLGHTVTSQPGGTVTTVELVSSPVFGKRIWIDAGHGKIPGGVDDPGAIGTTYGTQEKLMNLLVALELQKQLQAAGAIVYMTRTDGVGVDFTDRPALVNAVKPPIDIFISIHHNSLPSSSAIHGTETYYWTTNAKSKTLANLVHAAVVKNLGFMDRKVHLMDFFVIKNTLAPSILVELGYLTNPTEEKAIGEPGVTVRTYPAKAAAGIKNGIFDYFWQEIKPASAN